jgi:hypothetical protein
MSNGGVGVLGEGLQAVSGPMCPMLRPVQAGPLYPVQGYCVLGCSPVGLMIPSIAEFREFCSGPGFAACPWFGSAQDSRPAKREKSEQ